MDNEILKQFVLEIGLAAIDKTFDEVQSLFVGKDEFQDPLFEIAYRDGIFIFQKNDKWVIGFSQFAKTRALTFQEVKEAILSWMEGNSLQDYE